ncbi:hypothetical protein WMY93_031712 [Mugilogobius chulae]|uniref:Uncharacterized protein n=1 Tax=Mugilogobius chulae TaxID=88201 RepID=A0AAW0MDQ8_9GOBI
MDTGFCGAAASLSAKLSLGASFLKQMCASGLKDHAHGAEEACEWLDVPLRVLCGGLLLVCNTVMWTFFSKALRHSSSSARATVTTTASNFISSTSCADCSCFTALHLQVYREKKRQRLNDNLSVIKT